MSDEINFFPIEDDVYLFLKAHGKDIGCAANSGNLLAREVIGLYQVYSKEPDPALRTVLESAVRRIKKEMETKS